MITTNESDEGYTRPVNGECNPTVESVADSMERDPLNQHFTVGICFVCGLKLNQEYGKLHILDKKVQIPEVACEKVCRLNDEAYKLVERRRADRDKRPEENRQQKKEEERKELLAGIDLTSKPF